jgi:hypothetical protein
MKNNFSFAALAASATILVAATSCNKDSAYSLPRGDSPVSETVNVVFKANVPAPSTKAVVQTTEEMTVSRLEIYAFKADKSLENVYISTETDTDGQLEASLNLTYGAKTFYAVANGPADLNSGISGEDDLLAAISLFSQNSPSSFVMCGKSSAVVAKEGNDPVAIGLIRAVSRFEIKNITKQFSSSYLQDASFTIEKGFIANAPKQAAYFASAEHAPESPFTGEWGLFNVNGDDTSNPLLSFAPTSGAVSSTLSLEGNYLYAYPNIAPEAADPDETDYVTKIVLQARLDSQVMYYSIGIPSTSRNCSYTVSNLTIKRKGTDNPGEYLTSAALSYTLEVEDWNEGTFTGSYNDHTAGNFEF